MKNTQNTDKNSLWVELTAEETSLIKGGAWNYKQKQGGNGGGGNGGGGSNSGGSSVGP